jgi:hypothetical protein
MNLAYTTAAPRITNLRTKKLWTTCLESLPPKAVRSLDVQWVKVKLSHNTPMEAERRKV